MLQKNFINSPEASSQKKFRKKCEELIILAKVAWKKL